MNRPPGTFTTARLTGRLPRVDDAAAVFDSYASDPEVTRYLSWPAYTRLEPLRLFLSESISHWEKSESPFSWLLCLKGSDRPIGSIGLTLDRGKAMFGYVLAKKFWGHGFAAEALASVVEWSLAQPEISRAWAFCDVENPASVRVMEKAGMIREGLLRRWHVCPTIGLELRDCVVCAKVK
ncbi:MAG: GNAT family N-acetyltransferase [Opitutaceae bacterium]